MRFVFALVLTLGLAACDSDTMEEVPRYFQAQILLDDMRPVEGGARYEAWAKVDNVWRSIARFNYNEQGQLVDTGGRLIANTFGTDFDMAGATEMLVTVEGRRSAGEIPSNSQLLAGVVTGTTAQMTVEAALADFSEVSSTYTIGTPTDSDPNNEAFGVWLGAAGTYEPVMSAPALGEGWLYEFWIDTPAGPLSLGKFSDPASRDLSAPYSTTPETFGVPGEDLLRNAPAGLTFPMAVAGNTIFVTVEPNPEEILGTPFHVRILAQNIPAGASPGGSAPMTAVNRVPAGTITLR